jgi:hypothetical protein
MKAKQKPAAAPVAPALKLYKVLTHDGFAPFVPGYQWSVPTKAADGTWTPGAWHEEPAVELCAKGLHITAAPGQWMLSWASHGDEARPRIAYAVEAEGIVGDPADGDAKVIASRVRLLHPVTTEEVRAADAAWEKARDARRAENIAEERREEMRQLAAKAREAAAPERIRRAKGDPSPALVVFEVLWDLTPNGSRLANSHAAYEALSYLARHLRHDPDDVGAIFKKYGRRLDLGESGDERLYSTAVEAGNTSACVAWEKHLGRGPWWHRNDRGVRARIHEGSQIRVAGDWYRVTSFRDDYVNAVRTSGGAARGEGKVVRLTREQLGPKGAAR